MERRPYFIVGDVGASLTVGTVSALAVGALIPVGWSMWVGMLCGMAIGMLTAGLVGGTVFQVFFGALEIMIPAGLSGNIAGMVVGMLACTRPVAGSEALRLGVGCALLSLALVYGMNAYLTREGHSWTT